MMDFNCFDFLLPILRHGVVLNLCLLPPLLLAAHPTGAGRRPLSFLRSLVFMATWAVFPPHLSGSWISGEEERVCADL